MPQCLTSQILYYMTSDYILLASEPLGAGRRAALGVCDTKPAWLLIYKVFYIQRETSFSASMENPVGLLRQGRRQTERQWGELYMRSSFHLTRPLGWAKTFQCPGVTRLECFRVTTVLFFLLLFLPVCGTTKQDRRAESSAAALKPADGKKRLPSLLAWDCDQLVGVGGRAIIAIRVKWDYPYGGGLLRWENEQRARGHQAQ